MPNRPKVAHILYSGLGGHGSVFSSFVAGDEKQQLENLALYYGIEPLNEDYRVFCEKNGIRYQYISKQEGLDRSSWQAIRDQLKAWRPDVVMIHSCYTVIPAHRYAREAGIRLVTVEHTANQYKRPLEWLWSTLAMIWSDRVVFLTGSYREEVRKKLKFVFRKAKTRVIPNGLNTVLFSPAAKKKSEACHIGMHARLAAPKDFATLIRAFALLREEAPAFNFQLHIAGDGVFRDELEALVQSLGLEKQVEFVGMLNEKEVIHFLQNLDLYVHSTFGETMSTAIMQAMAVRLPIVVSDIEGTRNMIAAEKTGLFFQNEQPQDLAAQLLRLAKDDGLRQQLAENACRFARENYSHIRMFTRYFKLLNEWQ